MFLRWAFSTDYITRRRTLTNVRATYIAIGNRDLHLVGFIGFDDRDPIPP
jgi:hypothetical protein